MSDNQTLYNLPPEIINQILKATPLPNLLELCSSNRFFHLFCQDILREIAYQNYSNFFFLIPSLVRTQDWVKILKYFSVRRIIPVYEPKESKIIAYVIIYNQDSTTDLANLLRYLIDLLTFPQMLTADKLPLIQMSNLQEPLHEVDDSEYRAGKVILSTSTLQLSLGNTFQGTRTGIIQGFTIDPLPGKFIDDDKMQIAATRNVIYKVNDLSLTEVYISDLLFDLNLGLSSTNISIWTAITAFYLR